MDTFKTTYSKFFYNLLILLVLLIVCDMVIGSFLRHFYYRQESGLLYRTTYAIDSTNADILVFGSSRANHHYVPELFEENLNMSFYNSGREGNFLLYNYAVFKAIVRRHNPEIVIFDIDPNELYLDKTSYDRLSALLPYYRSHPEIRDIIELRSPFEKFKLFSKIYPYNSNLLTIAVGNLDLNKERKNDRKGYVPLFNALSNNVLQLIEAKDGIIDTNKVNAVNDIIKYCNSNNIKLLFIQSPMFAKVSNTTSSEYFELSAVKDKSIFLNFLNDTDFLNNPGFFQDHNHLNDFGARYFSNQLVNIIANL